MTEILLPKDRQDLPEPIENIGIQAFSGSRGSFHEIAVEEFFDVKNIESQLAYYDTHEKLVRTLGSGAIDLAMIAVDNNNSGRVMSAIEALRGTESMRIIGRVTIAVDQHLLYAPGTDPEEIEQVMSQQPALDQAAEKTKGLLQKSARDTTGSALALAKSDGKIRRYPWSLKKRKTAAIASPRAGEAAGLEIGERVSPEGNATTFWLVTTDPEKYMDVEEKEKQPTHAAFTFSLPDEKGALLRVISAFSDNGFDFTDIDSHLHSHAKDRREFFAEVALGDKTEADFMQAVELVKQAYEVSVLGVYEDRTDTSVIDAMEAASLAKTDDSVETQWNGRHGLIHENGSKVLYIEAKNQVGSLKGMLEAFDSEDINITDMSRPRRSGGNGRGFFFVLSPDTDTSAVMEKLEAQEYSAELYHYEDDKIISQAQKP